LEEEKMSEDSPKWHRPRYETKYTPTQYRTAEHYAVGIPIYCGKEVVGFDAALGRLWNGAQAEAIAVALNKAIDHFVEANHIPVCSRPFVKIKNVDLNDPSRDSALDRLANWLAQTDALREELEGSLIDEISRVQRAVIDFIGRAANIDAERRTDGTWVIWRRERRP
jgi:hypothetical protein